MAFIYILDMFLSINTMFYSNGFLVKTRKAIIKNYIKSDSIMDLLSLISFLFYNNEDNRLDIKIMRFLFFFRIKNLYQNYSRINEKFQTKIRIHPSFLDLINLFIFSFYILNTFACFWYFLSNFNSKQMNWLMKAEIENTDFQTKYIYSLYWSTVTIMTVGYGDITPSNNLERIFNIFTIFFGCGLFAYFINNIGIIVGKITKEKNIFEYKKKKNLKILF